MPHQTVTGILCELWARPGELLVRRWNWKSALFSSILRGLIFLFANITSGWRVAAGATLVEFLFRAATSGFYGSLIQAFRKAEPAALATFTLLIMLPFISHSMELLAHWAAGTPNLVRSMVPSVIFTEVAVLFNLYAMRRGALVVGEGASSMGSDLRKIPRLIGGFLLAGPAALARLDSKQKTILIFFVLLTSPRSNSKQWEAILFPCWNLGI
ncbi:MAG TPA: hypothetical protein VMT15_12715 [Bryobacteraceae bacterium]|nr:hypothetical protein [Bryobacteraceae bacterium]